MAETVSNWRVLRINGVEVLGSIEHLFWRLSDDNPALIPFVGEDACYRLFTHIGDTLTAARVEFSELQREKDADRATINRLDNRVLDLQKRVGELEAVANDLYAMERNRSDELIGQEYEDYLDYRLSVMAKAVSILNPKDRPDPTIAHVDGDGGNG